MAAGPREPVAEDPSSEQSWISTLVTSDPAVQCGVAYLRTMAERLVLLGGVVTVCVLVLLGVQTLLLWRIMGLLRMSAGPLQATARSLVRLQR